MARLAQKLNSQSGENAPCSAVAIQSKRIRVRENDLNMVPGRFTNGPLELLGASRDAATSRHHPATIDR
jgi:hypothetical protein